MDPARKIGELPPLPARRACGLPHRVAASLTTATWFAARTAKGIHPAACLLKDTTNRLGDLLDDGKPNQSFE